MGEVRKPGSGTSTSRGRAVEILRQVTGEFAGERQVLDTRGIADSRYRNETEER